MKALSLLLLVLAGPPSQPLLARKALPVGPPPSPADARFAAGDFPNALSMYEAMHQRAPKDVHVLLRLGELEVYADRLKEAKREFEAVLALDPANGDAKNGLEDINERTGASGTYQIKGDSKATFLPFVATDPLPIVKVRLNGHREGYFLIDTGAPGLVLDPGTAKALQLKVNSAGEGVFAGGQQARVMQSTLDEVGLGDAVVRHVPVAVLPMAGAPAPSNIHLDGIIGTSLLSHFLTTLDYRHGRLILAPRADSDRFEQSARRRGDSLVPLWYIPDHFLFVQASVSGCSAMFNVDTGGAGIGVQASKNLVERGGINLDMGHKGFVSGPGGDVSTIPFTASVLVGNTKVDEVPGVYMPDGDQYGIFPFTVGGTISHLFFRDQVVTFDFVAMRMILARP